MAKESSNLKICRVPLEKLEVFDNTIIAPGSIYLLPTEKELAIGDGISKGGLRFLSTAGGTFEGDLTVLGSLSAIASKAKADELGNNIVETYLSKATATLEFEKLASKEYVNDALANKMDKVDMSGIAIGMVIPFAGTGSVPSGFLECNGREVSRTTYAELFNAIGTTYGPGNGFTTFNLPNFVGKFLEGGSIPGEEHGPGLPNITAGSGTEADTCALNVVDLGVCESKSIGAIQIKETPVDRLSVVKTGGTQQYDTYAYFDASLSNPIYGASETVQPPSIVVRYIIKATASSSSSSTPSTPTPTPPSGEGSGSIVDIDSDRLVGRPGNGDFEIKSGDYTLTGFTDGTLLWDGNLRATTITATSDARLKSNIQDYDVDVSSLHAKKYVLNGRESVGLIAQEVQKVLPEAVVTNSSGYLALDYNAVIAILVNKVNILEQRITELEAK